MKNKETLSTAAGRPVDDDQNSITARLRGPILIQNYQLIEEIAHFNRERIPERVVHAKGSGVYGTFIMTGDVRKYTTAKLFDSPARYFPRRPHLKSLRLMSGQNSLSICPTVSVPM